MSARKLELVREFDVPVERLMEVFTQEAHLRQWWGPEGASVYHCEFRPEVGADWRIGVTTRDSQKRDVFGTVTRVEPALISFTWCWAHVDPETGTTEVTLMFEPISAVRSRLTLTQGEFSEPATGDAHQVGWLSSFNSLDHFVRASGIGD